MLIDKNDIGGTEHQYLYFAVCSLYIMLKGTQCVFVFPPGS